MMAVGGALKATFLPSREAILAHQPGGAAPAYRQALILQLAGHARTAIGLVREGEGRADVGQENQILPLARTGWTRSPSEVAARTDLEDLAQALDGELHFRRIDELEPHRLPSL